MKMVFFSRDRVEVERVNVVLAGAGIACEIRQGAAVRGEPAEVELWIKQDRELHRAFTLCFEHGIGFAKRRPPSSGMDSYGPAVAA